MESERNTSDMTPNQESSSKRFPTVDVKIPYPRSVFFLLAVIFWEHFSFGLNQAATLFALKKESLVKAARVNPLILDRIFHLILYFSSFIGAYLGDSYIGNYKAVLYTFPVFILGNILVIISFFTGTDGFIIFSIYFMAVIFGGIECSLVVLGADQFQMPHHKEYLSNYFLWYLFCQTTGKNLGTLAFATLVKIFHCVEGFTCPEASALIITTMSMAYVIYLLGMKSYRKLIPRKATKCHPYNLLSCFCYAISKRLFRRRHNETYINWMDAAREKYGDQLVYQVRSIIRVCIIFGALVVFWTLRNQLKEAWPLIAGKMNSTFKTFVLPLSAVMHALAIWTIFWIITFRYILFPFLHYIDIKYPLQYMVAGGFLTCLAMMMSAILGFVVDASIPSAYFKSGTSQLRIYNPTQCMIVMKSPDITSNYIVVKPMDVFVFEHISLTDALWVNYTLTTGCSQIFPSTGQFNLTEMRASGYYFRDNQLKYFEDNIFPSKSTKPLLRVLVNCKLDDSEPIILSTYDAIGNKNITDINQVELELKNYYFLNTKMIMGSGEVSVLLYDKLETGEVAKRVVTTSNSVPVLYIMPPFAIFCAGEVMLIASGLKFSYTEAPKTMKTTFQSLWYTTTGLGIMLQWPLDIIEVFPSLPDNLVFSSLLLLLTVFLLIVLSAKYNYSERQSYL